MRPPIFGQCAALLVCALVQGQTPGAQQNPPPASSPQQAEVDIARKPERLAVGLRIRSFPLGSLSVMADDRHMTTTPGTPTAFDSIFTTNSRSPRYGAGPAVEVSLSRRMTLTIEGIFDRLRYEKVADTFSGTDDPATGHDERSHRAVAETTKARLWDFPVMLHYRGLLSHLYVAGGVTARTVTHIRTTNDITNVDTSTARNDFRAQPSRRNLLGAVVGLGFRFIDDFNFKVTPEVRFTRWSGSTFRSESTRSPLNQLEFGIGFTR